MNRNKLVVFESEQFGKVRTVEIESTAWFVGKEIAAILGYERITKAVVDHVDEDDRMMLTGKTQSCFGIELGQRGGWLINESGLYSLILESKMPSAKQFKRWVTSEVLPSIRKHGAYMTDTVIEQLYENPELVPKYLHRLRDENARAKEFRQQLEAANAQLTLVQPKADYYNAYIDIRDSLCFRYVAKELGISERKLIRYFLEKGFLYRDIHRGGAVFPKANKKNTDLFVVRDFHAYNGHRGQYTVLTVAGREYALNHREEILTFEPIKNKKIAPGICPEDIASARV